MVRRLVLMNLLLLAVVVAGVLKLRRDATAFASEHHIDKIQPESEKPLPKAAEAVVTASPKEWTEIASRNPFSFDRNDVPIVASVPTPQQPMKPKPVLYGTMLLGQDHIALMSPSGNRGSVPLKLGQTVDGWTLVGIQDKSVTVQWESVKETIILNDPTAQAARIYDKTGGTSNNGNQQPVVNVTAQQEPAAQANPTPANANTTNPTPAPAGRRVLATPFGNVVIDAPPQE